MTVTGWMPGALLRGGCGWYLMWEHSSRGSVGWARRGQSPEPLAVQTCAVHLQVSQQRAGAAWEMGVAQATQSDTAPREWGMKCVCESGGERGCSGLAPGNMKMPLPGARAGGSWQVRKGTVMSPALPICCLAKASADLPRTALQALSGIPACVRHPSRLFPVRRSTRDPL